MVVHGVIGDHFCRPKPWGDKEDPRGDKEDPHRNKEESVIADTCVARVVHMSPDRYTYEHGWQRQAGRHLKHWGTLENLWGISKVFEESRKSYDHLESHMTISKVI
jgi:hypothetical protein